MKRLIAHLTTLTCTLLLAGCASLSPLPQTVKVPVPVPCNITVPTKPYMPYTESKVDAMPKDVQSDLFIWVKLLRAEIETRIGYEGELEAGITACNFKAQPATPPNIDKK